jgi:fumarate hydratase class II
MQTRIEHDTMGEVEVPNEAYGVHKRNVVYRTLKSVKNVYPCHDSCDGFGKKAAAITNAELKQLPQDLSQYIVDAAEEVIAGQWDSQFPLVVWQTGSGTQSNMNCNEVIANIANQKLGQVLGAQKPVHPNDHVNRAQSPFFQQQFMWLQVLQINELLIPAVEKLKATLQLKSMNLMILSKLVVPICKMRLL